MAEKEEKIEIITIQQRTITTRDYETNDEIISKFYPRQEAIKKISSHLLMCDISTMDTDEIAEAALNALLGKE